MKFDKKAEDDKDLTKEVSESKEALSDDDLEGVAGGKAILSNNDDGIPSWETYKK
jgi:hypothetical protein